VRRAGGLLLGLLVAASCGPLEVRLGFLPDAGPGEVKGPPCTTNRDCRNGSFCDRPGCTGTGHCQQRPASLCGSARDPVCGCDDITYFNDCYRRQHGVSRQGGFECGTPLRCGEGDAGCPEGAVCAHLTLACGEPDGVCWVAPATCPGTVAYQDCADRSVCRDECQAIASGRSFGYPAAGSCP
jgi:hypothetical protein